MVQLTELAHQFVKKHLRLGDIAIDATCGNGHDVRFLSEIVGETGQVFACDLQQVAIDATQRNCSDCQNIDYHLGDHADVLHLLLEQHAEQVAVVMFNLGYLPRGDKTKMTTAKSTLQAIEASIKLLKPGGVLSVLAYVGHPGGQAEADAVAEKLHDWSGNGTITFINSLEAKLSKLSPRLYVVSKSSTTA